MRTQRTRFRVRETTVDDPEWDAAKVIRVWERMLCNLLLVGSCKLTDEAARNHEALR